MRVFFLIYFFVVALVLVTMGFQGQKFRKPPLELFPDMDRQAKFHEQSSTSFFDDGRTDRPPVPGAQPHLTVMQREYEHLRPDNYLRSDPYLQSGRAGQDGFGDGIPVPITNANMLKGQELYDIYCTVCHGASGNGNGVIKDQRYTYPTIASLLQQRIIDQPDGEIYNTITNGKNTMYPYGSKIRVEDRWKVVMYVRALQRAGTATVADVPAEHRGELGL